MGKANDKSEDQMRALFDAASLSSIGLDGCRGGWVAARLYLATGETGQAERYAFKLTVIDCVSQLQAFTEATVSGASGIVPVGIDIPIGLPSGARPGPRPFDVAARRLLGKGRAASVFSPPAQEALHAVTYPDALALNRAAIGKGLSIQSYNLLPKIREVAAWLSTLKQSEQMQVMEVHPECAFAQMAAAAGSVLPPSKKVRAGELARMRLLRSAGVQLTWPQVARGREGPGLSSRSKLRAKTDDVLDAVAAAWGARQPRQADVAWVSPGGDSAWW